MNVAIEPDIRTASVPAAAQNVPELYHVSARAMSGPIKPEWNMRDETQVVLADIS
jgi:hypothetical protein